MRVPLASHCTPAKSDVTSRHHLESGMIDRKNGLTYADSGVDIDAGNRLVDLIKPMVRATARAGADAEIGGETAEMPGLYKDGDYDLAGFAVGAAERGTLLPRPDIAVGDAVLGLASSGLHSNGFSLVRKIVETSGLSFEAQAPFSPVMTLGGALLTPTRLYVRSCLRAIHETGAVKGLAHITGGGFTDNIPRVLPRHLGVGIDLARLPVLPVFKWLAEQGGIAELELLRTFNCGIGMIAIVKSDAIEQVTDVLTESGETVALLGEVIPAAGEHRVVYNGHLDLAQ